VRDEIKDLVLSAVGVQYISESCQDAIKTGNHYQSLTLGDASTQGFRTERAEFLDRIDFRGKKVLDLGSNLGEMSRGARARGARLVDGFEYDPYFVEIAGLVNVHNNVSRVSFYRRDMTDSSIYGEPYDIVLVLSVFIYAGKVVDRLAEVTDLLVLETHKLHGNLEETYIDPVSEYFPFYEVLGETEWGTIHDAKERRAVLVFAKSEELLRATLVDRPPASTPSAWKVSKDGRETFSTDIDLGRTRLYQRFFERFSGDTSAEILAAVAAEPLELDTLSEIDEFRRAYAGWTYWFLFLRGYLQYRAAGAVDPDNVYLQYLSRYFGPQGSDPSFSRLLADETAAATAVERRFRDLAHFEGAETTAYAPPPVSLVLSDPPRANQPVLITSSGERIEPRQLDGWHRLFAAKVFGVARLPAEVIRSDARVGAVLAAIEHFSYDGDVVELSGWGVSPEMALHNAQLSAVGVRVANAEIRPRDDVAAWFADIPHARWSGFHFRGETRDHAQGPIDFAVTVMEDWLPVGRLELPYVPGMLDDPRRPPAALARRLTGQEDQTAVAARSARSTKALLGPVRQQRDLESIDTALEWGVDTGLLQPALTRELEGVALTGVGFDREAIEWARAQLPGEFVVAARAPALDLPAESFELVVGFSTLPRLTRHEQRLWLAELHRLTRAGGLLSLSVQGELLRGFAPPEVTRQLEREGIGEWARGSGGWQPAEATIQTKDYTVLLCWEWFEVVEYAEGAVDDREDLILLRKG
jgi:hypothetical protein